MKRFSILIAITCVLVFPLPAISVAATALEKVTTHPALDYFASPSPDGRFLAFVSERSGNADIWVKSLAAGAVSLPRQLTTHPAIDRDPALNADGTRLLYVSHKTDPRGDVYLLDLVTGEEIQLTDIRSGDSTPQWDVDHQSFFYLKQDPTTGKQSVYRHVLKTQEEKEVVRGTSAFSVGEKGQVVYSENGALRILNPSDPENVASLTSDVFFDSWPALITTDSGTPSIQQTVYFTRYEEDTNQDGVVDTDDESSIWLTRWHDATPQTPALYRLTPSGQFHLYPASAKKYVYFTDLKKGNIFRIHVENFLIDYESLETSKELATLYVDTGQQDLGHLVLSNISHNLAPGLSFPERAEFDFSYVESLMQAKKHSLARVVLAPYVTASGKIGTRAQLETIVLDVHQRAKTVGETELKRVVANGVTKLMAIGEAHRSDDSIYGQALIEAGRLHLLVEDSLSALDFLVKADELQNKEIRGKALFARGIVYRTIGDQASLLQVFIDVIRMFGENSSWGRRAITQAIAVSEQGEDVHQQVASLNALVHQHPDLPLLSASTTLRIADLYDKSGEQLKALEALNKVLDPPPPFPKLVKRAYRRKAEILAASERYQEAAETYRALVDLTGEDQTALDRTKQLVVLQLVRKAHKDRSRGEVRIAAKAFKRIIDEHSNSVEAHRGYIETKVMLKEVAEVQTLYKALVTAHPDDPVHRYGLGLALSYSEPPDFPRVIKLMEQAIQKDPGISYFHQTLGWAFEQEERIHGKKWISRKSGKGISDCVGIK